ncbi:MAG: 4,5-DOPA dioxygenase extradiol [Bacteroidales bacterium]
MPAIFVGHGSPMNSIELNEFSNEWRKIGRILPEPEAIICISAHWETRGTFVTATEKPRTIHDFGGFPQELYEVEYPAPGNPELASLITQMAFKTKIEMDASWGFDHGAWSVLKHFYPEANIPLVQLSLDYTKSPQYHYEFAKQLAPLRERGVLIIGSGNIVHNLRTLDWKMPEAGFDWAVEADTEIRKLISEGNHKPLINYEHGSKAFKMSVPSPEHFLPLLYILALQRENENINFFNTEVIFGSVSMTSLIIGMNETGRDKSY